MKTSKLLIERVMTRQYWEKRHARDKYRLEQGFSKYLNGSSVSSSRRTPTTPNNQTQSSKTSRFDRAKCRRLPTKIYYQSPRKIFSQKCMSCCQIFRSLFPSNALLWTRHLSLFSKKNVTIKWLPTCADYCCHKTLRAAHFERQGALPHSCARVESVAERPLLRLICIFNHSPDTLCSCVCHYPNGWEFNFPRE